MRSKSARRVNLSHDLKAKAKNLHHFFKRVIISDFFFPLSKNLDSRTLRCQCFDQGDSESRSRQTANVRRQELLTPVRICIKMFDTSLKYKKGRFGCFCNLPATSFPGLFPSTFPPLPGKSPGNEVDLPV